MVDFFLVLPFLALGLPWAVWAVNFSGCRNRIRESLTVDGARDESCSCQTGVTGREAVGTWYEEVVQNGALCGKTSRSPPLPKPRIPPKETGCDKRKKGNLCPFSQEHSLAGMV